MPGNKKPTWGGDIIPVAAVMLGAMLLTSTPRHVSFWLCVAAVILAALWSLLLHIAVRASAHFVRAQGLVSFILRALVSGCVVAVIFALFSPPPPTRNIDYSLYYVAIFISLIYIQWRHFRVWNTGKT
jgi:hypothetical protein